VTAYVDAPSTVSPDSPIIRADERLPTNTS
jgi:hypothetical protein